MGRYRVELVAKESRLGRNRMDGFDRVRFLRVYFCALA